MPSNADDQAASMRTAVAPTELERDAVLALAPERASTAATHGALLLRVLFPDGSPAEGVGLRVYAWGESSWRDNRTDGVTDAAGELALERIHAGRVGIYCDRGGDQGFGATVEVSQRTVRAITLPVGVQVAGEVVDARGMPIARAGVWLSESPLPEAGRIAAHCDELGRFELRDVSSHRFLGARATGYAPSDVEWLGSGGVSEGSSAKLRIVLPDAGGSIAGSVVDAHGAAVAGALVVVRSAAARRARLRADGALLGPSTPLEAIADARGRFALSDLAFGELQLAARADGVPEQLAAAVLSPAAPHGEIELRFPAVGRLRGTVRYPDGEPAVGAVVIASNGGHGMVDREVDARGEFALDGLAPGTIDVQAGFGHAAGGTLVQAALWLAEGGEVTWDPIVERPSDFAGRVVDAHGEPLSGAWVRAVDPAGKRASAKLFESDDALAAWLLGWPDRHVKQGLEQIAADAEGRFTLSGVPQSFAIEVRWPDGRAGWPVRVFDPPPANGELVLPTDARHSAGLSGTVVRSDGRPIECAEVYAVMRTAGEMRGRLDGNAGFRFESLPPGTFDVLVWARGSMPRIVATASLAEGELRDLGLLQLAH